MSRRDYCKLAAIAGNTLAAARKTGGEDFRTAIYAAMYEPLVAMLAADNPHFDMTRFAFATAQAEQSE